MSERPHEAAKPADAARRARAEGRRGRITLRKSRLGALEHDFSPVRGGEALTLLTALTLEAWSLSGRPLPGYTRAETPYRFVAGSPE